MKKIFLETILMILLCSAFYSPFSIQSVKAMGTIYIEANGSINPSSAPISTSDNITYRLAADISETIIIQRSNMILDGALHTIQGDGTGNAFSLQDVANVMVKNTTIRDCFDGIQLFNSSNSIITSNDIAGSGYEGLGIYYSFDNVISGNSISNNQIGIALYNSSGTSVFHNRLINNTYQVYTEFSVTAWDNSYPSGGNYWDDYPGVDIYSGAGQNQPGSDGIGDTLYNASENDQDMYPLMQSWVNLAVEKISPSKTAVGEGYKVYIVITLQNEGWNAVTTELRVYANATTISTITGLAIAARDQTALTITWQTTSTTKGNYIINATAAPVPNEPDVRDNNRTYERIVKVTIVGDGNGDGVVDIYDAITLSNAFTSVPGSPTWNGNADINSDNVVDIYDAIILANNYGKKI